MRKFLNWLFNPRNAGISSALIVGFVAGMGGMSFYIGTMIDTGSALMSRLWTGFFGNERYRTPKIFQNPDFSLKRRDFWVFL
ncbi:hypothetical protein [Weissella confusa]|uniref:hypothetical protein n=1 Tax=Weissella confusa TaxID=1583 RepID=UPI0018F10899|nr:hypothetical protein [Weissella confusa]MBJ7644202.1 hypothetical protein [Weissella confusa]